jgi:hypothetical protein
VGRVSAQTVARESAQAVTQVAAALVLPTRPDLAVRRVLVPSHDVFDERSGTAIAVALTSRCVLLVPEAACDVRAVLFRDLIVIVLDAESVIG